MMNKKRTLTPYEKNQLLKYGIAFEKLTNTDAPVEYITGHVDFMELDFYISSEVLIPRIETEELVEMAIEKAKQISAVNPVKTLQIIDVGTGSGAIAISVAKKLIEEKSKISFEIVGLDVSKKALSVAKKNLEKISANGELPVKFVESDLLSEINLEVDLIIANLPYIPSERIKKLDNSVKNFEPRLALDGGADGLNLIRKLLKQAISIISKNGAILLELDVTHDQEKMKEFESDWKVEIIESKHGGVYFGVLSKLHYH